MAWESLQQIRVLDGEFEHSGAIHVLNQKSYDLGRLPRDYEPSDTEILFREPTLSRIHATLTWKSLKRGYLLTHKSDVNPTLLNGRPVKKILLAPGDRIQLGLLVLELEEAAPGAQSRGVDRAEILKKLHAIVTEAERKYAHVKLDQRQFQNGE